MKLNRRGLLKGLLALPAVAVLGGREADKSQDRFQPRDAHPVDLTATTTGSTSTITWTSFYIKDLSGGVDTRTA